MASSWPTCTEGPASSRHPAQPAQMGTQAQALNPNHRPACTRARTAAAATAGEATASPEPASPREPADSQCKTVRFVVDELSQLQCGARYRHLRANFTYDVIPIALFQAPIYVTSGNEALM